MIIKEFESLKENFCLELNIRKSEILNMGNEEYQHIEAIKVVK
jgi:hypothetical protein